MLKKEVKLGMSLVIQNLKQFGMTRCLAKGERVIKVHIHKVSENYCTFDFNRPPGL